MPDVWMRISKAEPRWCSNDFEIVSGWWWCRDESGVAGYGWRLIFLDECKSIRSFAILLFEASSSGKGCRICDKKLGGRPICIGRKGFIGWGWVSGPCKAVGAGWTVTNTTVNHIQYNLPRFDCFNLASAVAGSLSLLVDCFCSNVGNVTSIPTDGALGESSGAYDELSSLNWKRSGEGDPKLESCSNVGNASGTSIPTGGASRGSTDGYDELSSLSWKNSGEAIRRRDQAECIGVYDSESPLTIDRELRRILNSGRDNLEHDGGTSLRDVLPWSETIWVSHAWLHEKYKREQDRRVTRGW